MLGNYFYRIKNITYCNQGHGNRDGLTFDTIQI